MANFYSGMMGAMGGDIGNAGAVDVAGVFKKRMQQADPRIEAGIQQMEFEILKGRQQTKDDLMRRIEGMRNNLVNMPGANVGNVAGISFDINESPKNRKMRAIKNLSETGVGGEKEAAIEKLKQMGGPQLPLAMGNPLYQMGNMAGVYGPVPFS
tara:strand:+ start:64 stop:525 length:462 start_codon:yes stop_codon:yes gene_type:complete